MAERKRIALDYRIDYNFASGIVIYMQNLVKAFKLLDDSIRPHLTIIYSNTSLVEEIKKINYPHISFYLYRPIATMLWMKAANKLSRMMFNTNLFKRLSFPKVDILYPYFSSPETYFFTNRIYWKPDFQELYFPQYIAENERSYSAEVMKSIAQKSDSTLVVSSKDAGEDFRKFYGPFLNKVKILRFVSILPDISKINREEVLKKYEITKKYFVVSNQFWPHKNHILVLEALRNLIRENYDFLVVMTGKKGSHRDSEYLKRMEQFIADNGLADYIRITGFISREEQLVLMKNAEAVIQPSLFEGWSTVIEDCKALGQYVLASDLEVNKEQVKENCSFFMRTDSAQLAILMKEMLAGKKKNVTLNYPENIELFKKEMIKVFELG